ncbi:M15 family metallopeptidase [Leucobacter luti]|uniref:D-alanyl-D-alanine carboxypeptidase n=1 Tax=Leucobacter luti TaxID=340320 RepID=A0A4Q7U038_9MICO|nr:M15 family metallopeptidase [Leucobacter luti]MBL3698715.1 D-alanyl-D-alanine carboxypeptidase family protein [Leucobacter luti]RZT66090.1 D-alanyl-D-alanine carboxypeptidase [Leucobacter luti]
MLSSHGRRAAALAGGLALALSAGLVACAPEATVPTPSPADTAAPTATPTPEPTPLVPEFDPSAHSIDDPTSIWVVSNKLRPLTPVDFAPEDLVMPEGVENEFSQPLREAAARAAEQFVGAAAVAGQQVRIISAYRDYDTQVSLYDGYVARDGQDAADTYSARPGHSEHQTGLVIDLDDHGDCYLAACFGETPAGSWLALHAFEYGFIVRYPAGKEDVTGFMPEPWHFRYVGAELAAEMRDRRITTLEEFFELPPAPGYAQ